MNDLQYEAILNQYEWIEEDYRHEVEKKKQAIARATVLANVGKYIRTHKREHRQTAIAILELCSKLGYITFEENEMLHSSLKERPVHTI